MTRHARETLPTYVTDAQAAVQNVGTRTACGFVVLVAILLGTTIVDAGRDRYSPSSAPSGSHGANLILCLRQPGRITVPAGLVRHL